MGGFNRTRFKFAEEQSLILEIHCDNKFRKSHGEWQKVAENV